MKNMEPWKLIFMEPRICIYGEEYGTVETYVYGNEEPEKCHSQIYQKRVHTKYAR